MLKIMLHQATLSTNTVKKTLTTPLMEVENLLLGRQIPLVVNKPHWSIMKSDQKESDCRQNMSILWACLCDLLPVTFRSLLNPNHKHFHFTDSEDLMSLYCKSISLVPHLSLLLGGKDQHLAGCPWVWLVSAYTPALGCRLPRVWWPCSSRTVCTGGCWDWGWWVLQLHCQCLCRSQLWGLLDWLCILKRVVRYSSKQCMAPSKPRRWGTHWPLL